MEGPVDSLLPRPTPRSSGRIDRIPLPKPTNADVQIESMHRILEFEPKLRRGDVDSLIDFGPSPGILGIKAHFMAKKLLPNFRGYQDDRDAVRHALWSFLIARHHSPETAKFVTDGHERRPGLFGGNISGSERPGGTLQDLYNNRVGREAAREPRNRDRKPEHVIIELYRAGKLQTRPFRLK